MTKVPVTESDTALETALCGAVWGGVQASRWGGVSTRTCAREAYRTLPEVRFQTALETALLSVTFGNRLVVCPPWAGPLHKKGTNR